MPRFVVLSLTALSVIAAMFCLPDVLRGEKINYIVDPKLEGEAITTALRKLTPADISNLQKLEIDSLVREPFSAASLKNLILLYSLGSDKQIQEQLALQTSKFSKRNIAGQVETINIMLSRRRFAEALTESDSLVRARPQMTKIIFPALLSLTADKDGLEALANMLRQDPPWRAEFIAAALEKDIEGNVALAIFNALRKQKAALNDDEVPALIRRLVVAKKIEKAYFLWLDFLPAEDLRYVERVFDGGFDREPRSVYFDWTIRPRKNAQIKVANTADAAHGRILTIDFFDDQGFFGDLFQYLQIFPGKYQISYDHKAQDLFAVQGLVWVVTCNNGTVLGKSERMSKSGPWQSDSFLFEIPETNCDSQVVRLESASAAELDTQISGQISFDQIRILPIDGLEDQTLKTKSE
jgi:hypothetical protein